jgi:phage gpG-like protein
MNLTALFFINILVNCYYFGDGFIHIIERVISNLEDTSPIKIKSCKNCKYYIENDKPEYSRCAKFMKNRKTHYIKASGNISQNDESLKYFLTTTSRNNEALCGFDAKYFERKYNDCY